MTGCAVIDKWYNVKVIRKHPDLMGIRTSWVDWCFGHCGPGPSWLIDTVYSRDSEYCVVSFREEDVATLFVLRWGGEVIPEGGPHDG